MRSREYDTPNPSAFHHSNQWGGYEFKGHAFRQPKRNRTLRLGGFLITICVLLAITAIPILHVVIPNFNQSVPSIDAASAMMIDATTENVLYHSHETTQRAMASLTKIMTAMIAIESTPGLNRQVTIGDDVTRIGDDASKMGCQPGEKYSMKDLLYGLLLPSGDDAAIAIADGVSGSESAFVDRMNQKAHDLLLKNTHFVNPHGLDVDSSLHDGNYTTALDLIRLTQSAMKLWLFRLIVGTA